MADNTGLAAALAIALGGSGSGGSSGIKVGIVTNGSSFPTARPDSSPLQAGDYVAVSNSSTFPFTIGSCTFNSSRDTGVFDGAAWQVDAGVAQDTDETPVSSPEDESITGDALMQNEINIENKKRIGSGTSLPSGEFEGQLFLLLEDVDEASGTVIKGTYRFNGNTWDLVKNYEGVIELTYSELVALKNASKLIPGQSYRITDYVTKLNAMTYTMSAGGNWKVAKSMEQPFDLIVTAVTNNKLNENAKAANHPGAAKQFRNPDGWTIKYDISNNTDKYNWADTTNGKGVIWYMEDDYGNVAYYDFKNVVYQRAKVLTCPFNPRMVNYYVGMPKLVNTSPAHGYQIYTMPYNPNTAYGDATLDLEDTVWLYTWNGLNTTWSPLGSQDTLDATEDITTLCGGNKMFTPAQQYQSGTVNDKIILPNTVFSGSPRMTYMGYRCLNNTLMQVKQSQSSSPGTMYSIRLSGLNYAITVLNNAYALEFDDECYYITAYSSVYAKFMKYSYGINIIGGSYNEYYRCRYVTIGQIGTTNSYGHKICYDLYGSQTNNVTLYKDGASDNNPEIINGTSSQTTTSEHSKFLTTKDAYTKTETDTLLENKQDKIEEFSPSEAFADGSALKISTAESNAKAVVYDGKWLELNTYFASSVSQTTAGWVSALKVNPNFKYKIDTTRQSRTLGSMWAGGAYVNTAFSRLTSGDIGMYYYGALLNQSGGVNAMLRVPVVLK